MMISQVAKTSELGSMIGRFALRTATGKLGIKDRQMRTQFFTETTSEFSRRALERMNAEVEVIGFDRQMMSQRNFLLVSNHLSYVDALVMASILPCVFVTSVDMGETKFLGTIAELGGSIFVERRNRSQVQRDLSIMTQALREGFQVVIYPEGTSSNGDTVLPFKKSLLMASVESGRDILPVCIRYVEINGEPFSESNRDLVCWYGKMTFLSHFMKLMHVGSLKVQVQFMEPIPVTEKSTREELAQKSYAMVSQAYHQHVPQAKTGTRNSTHS